jgi:hypothetical protein
VFFPKVKLSLHFLDSNLRSGTSEQNHRTMEGFSNEQKRPKEEYFLKNLENVRLNNNSD